MLQEHSGFNLVVGDMQTGEVAYVTNRDANLSSPQLLPKGIYGLSNGVLSSKWHKSEKGKSQLKVSFLNTNAH